MNKHTVFFVGIKGVGMAALAQVVKEKGHIVVGSDVGDVMITDHLLNRAGITIHTSFDSEYIDDYYDLVIYSASHGGSENPQVVRARELGITTMTYAKALQYFFQDKKIIAIAGTHGKTTTTAMLATILKEANLDPSWIIGTGDVSGLSSNGHYDNGEYAVIEADEYVAELGDKSKFLYLSPFGLIITSIDWDHPDVFQTESTYIQAFHALIKRVVPNGILVVKDMPILRKLTRSIDKVKFINEATFWPNLKLSVIGKFNYFNATCAARMAHELGVSQEIILNALKKYHGVARRLEDKGIWGNWQIYDDYAHHPNEIKATLEALKKEYPNHWLTVLFQSHTYSRTSALLKDFGQSFSAADEVLLAPIFSSARENQPEELPDLFNELKKNHTRVSAVSSKDDVKHYLEASDIIQPKIFVTMGAGDVYTWIPNEHFKN